MKGMNDRVEVIFLSPSQLMVGTDDVEESIKAFAQHANKYESSVKCALAFDMVVDIACCGAGVINQYKRGQIDEMKFYDGIRKRLLKSKKDLPDDKIRICWNAMCRFNEEAQRQCCALKDYLHNNRNVHIVFAGTSNREQMEYVKQQFNGLVGDECRDRVHFINSYDEAIHSLDKQKIVTEGMKKLQADKKIPSWDNITQVTSLHRDIKVAELVNGRNITFVQIPTNKNTDCIETIRFRKNVKAELSGVLKNSGGQGVKREEIEMV